MKSLRGSPILVLLLAVSAVVAPPAGAAPATAQEVFARANRLYDDGRYAAAAALYDSLVTAGFRAADLYFNQGDAWFKQGRLGRAILAWERARRLAPRDPDVRANLTLARHLVADQQFLPRPGRLRRLATWVPDHLSERELWWLVLALEWWLAGLALLLIFRRTDRGGRFYRRLSWLSPGRLVGLGQLGDLVLGLVATTVLLGVTVGSAVAAHHRAVRRSDAVVVTAVAPVRSAPDSAAVRQFDLHEGTVVRIGRRRDGWVEVRLPGELSGWVTTGALEGI